MLNTHTFFNYTLTKWGKKMVWLSSILFGPTKTLSPQIDEKTREKMEKWVLDKIGPAASHVFLSLFFFFAFFSFQMSIYYLFIYFCIFCIYFFYSSFAFFFFSILSFFFLYFFLFIFFMFWCSSFIFSKDFILFIFWERNFGFLNFLCFIKKKMI